MAITSAGPLAACAREGHSAGLVSRLLLMRLDHSTERAPERVSCRFQTHFFRGHMRFPKTLVCVVAFVALLSVGRSAQAQTTYEISVVLDDSTAADGDLLNAAVLAAPSGEAVPSIRKLAAGLMLEVRLLVQQRVQDRILTLDDGVQVPLVEGDSIKAKMKKRCTSPECVPDYGAILVGQVPGTGSGTPSYILIYKDGVCARSLTFPGDGHKPFVQTGCAPPVQ
jgi:hypothetical protein